MSQNKTKEIDIKNHTYYFFDDMINIKKLGPSKIKIDKNWYESIHTKIFSFMIFIYKVSG